MIRRIQPYQLGVPRGFAYPLQPYNSETAQIPTPFYSLHSYDKTHSVESLKAPPPRVCQVLAQPLPLHEKPKLSEIIQKPSLNHIYSCSLW